MDLAWQAGLLWAKQGNPPHSILAHALDTAAVAQAVLLREPCSTLWLYSDDWELNQTQTVVWVSFLAGLHDLGKASPIFQMAWEEGAQRIRQAGFDWEPELENYWVSHGVFTELFVRRLLKKKGVAEAVANDVGRALGAHHGFPTTGQEEKDASRHLCMENELWWEARSWLFSELARCLGVKVFPRIKEVTPEALLRVMALASFSDWVASDPNLFPYGRDPKDPCYWATALSLAERALNTLGWRSFQRAPVRSFQDLFPYIPEPNALQKAVPKLLQGVQAPLLLLVEAPMGMGKTEAALYAYHLLQQTLKHRGLYVALPTQATSNGLFPRVKAFLERLAEGQALELQLQHGTALLNPDYEALLERARPEQIGEEREDGGVIASGWFSARKRAMLAPHGVGTLDQALLGVLRVRHHFVRLWGLMNRVVILDEVHAYDVYTSGLLLALLRWLKALGSSVILMTATLPSSRRKALLATWTEKATSEKLLKPYPRVVLLTKDGTMRSEPISPAREVKVALEVVDEIAEETLAQRLQAFLPGALGVVVNTVDRAQALYRALGEGNVLTLRELVRSFGNGSREGIWKEVERILPEKGDWVVGKRLADGTIVFLLHARFPAEERALREAVVLALFGKQGPRPQKAILVATQVAEQSLDLDFDLLYSDLAPIDLLFQRVGRLHRHVRSRPSHLASPRLLLGIPKDLKFGEPLYWDRVYEDFVLLATWKALQGRNALRIPSDLEGLLETVYEASPEDFPQNLRKRAEESFQALKDRQKQEEERAKRLSLYELGRLLAYGDEAEMVAQLHLEDDEEREETQRLLTRLGAPSVAVVPLFKVGDGFFLDPVGRRPALLHGELTREQAQAIFRRAVRLSRSPIPQTLLQEEPPPAWRKHSLLRGLRGLEVGRRFGEGKEAFRVDLDPELGVIYTKI